MEKYKGWKAIKDLSIVYSIKDMIEFNGKKYHKAYVTEAKNKKQLESALKWANGRYTRPQDNVNPKIINTTNECFSFQVVSAAENSWSQGGKLSFWMCLIEKEGVEPFVVGINSDLLCDFILETVLTNGKSNNRVFFARNNGQLGILHKDMPAYQELLKDEQLKKNITKGKTSKWKTGYSYKTLTTDDVMLGVFSNILTSYSEYKQTYDVYDKKYLHQVFKLDFNQPDIVIYTHNYGAKDNLVTFYNSILYSFRMIGRYAGMNTTKCPARQEGEQIFEASDTYYSDFVKYVLSNNKPTDIVTIINYAFPLFKHNPNATLELLHYAKKFYMDAINEFETKGIPDWVKNKKIYLENARAWPIKKVIRHELYNDDYSTMNVEYLGERTECSTWTEVLDKMIEITIKEMEKIGTATENK